MTDSDLPRNPVRPLLHLKCSWLKWMVSKHCISHVPPCLVSGCASCINHNDKWPSDPLYPFLVLSAYYKPVMVKMISKRNGFPGGEDSVDSRISMDRGVSTTVYWTIPYLFNLKSFEKPTYLHLSYLKDSTRIITSKNQSWRANPQGLQDLAVKCWKMWML